MNQPERTGKIGHEARILRGLLTLIAFVASVWLLRQIAPFAVPLVAAVFVALIVAPIDTWVSERVPQRLRWIGHAAAMAVILVVLALFSEGIYIAAEQAASRFTSVSASAAGSAGEAGSEAGGSGSGEAVGLLTEVRNLASSGSSNLVGRLAEQASSYASTILASMTALLTGLVLVFFFTLLMLVEAGRWRSKVAALLDDPRTNWFATLDLIAGRLRHYLLVRTVLGVLTAALYVGWLALFGVDLLIVWGLLAFLLNYVPTLGSLVAGVLPVLYTFVTKDFGTALLVGGGIFAIEQVMGNFVDPRVQGSQLSVSPLVILVVLVFWSWVWGIPGAILAVPITIAMIIVFARIPALRPVALLFSNERDLAGLDKVTQP